MAVFETVLRSDLTQPVQVKQLSGNLFSADNNGNRITVEVTRNGEPVELSGLVSGYVIRADGQTVYIPGTIEENTASIVLPISAYAIVGNVSIVIKVGTTTVGACTAYVHRTTTDTIVDPAHVMPSIEELLQIIDDCEQATIDANAAAQLANTKAELADEKATLANDKAALADEKAQLANDKAALADDAATSANTAAGTANTAAGKIDNMTVAATGLNAGTQPTATISEVEGHKHIAFGIPKGDQGVPGKDFCIRRTFVSEEAMEAYDPDEDPSIYKVLPHDFVMIDTGDVEDPETGRLYYYAPEEDPVWRYIGDLSGKQGIKGETGTGIASITMNSDYTITIWMDDGVTSYTTTSLRGAKGETGATGPRGATGAEGPASYTYVKWSEDEPQQDSDMKDTPDKWMGIYVGTDSTAPETYTSYAWYEIKGDKGDTGNTGPTGATGADGVDAYVYIRYSENQPTQDSDMSVSPNEWIGIYAGSSPTAPTTYTSYTWYKFKGPMGPGVPEVTSADNNKILKVVDGAWAASEAPTELPAVTSSDNGKVLEVSDGAWATGSKKIDKEYEIPDDWNWKSKAWSGLTSFYGTNVWTDGDNIYYSDNSSQYVLEKTTSTWLEKTWTGLTSIYGNYIWTDGENIYYSNGSSQYVLDKSTSTWSAKTWTGLTNFYRSRIWTDGENIYYSNGSSQYVLNKSNSTWSAKTWTGLTNFDGRYIWTDGDNIYYSYTSNQYILNKSTSTWSTKTWTGLTSYSGLYVWTDGENTYYSSGSSIYVLNKSTSTWSTKTWTGLTAIEGDKIWTDGKNIYYSNGSAQYKSDKYEDKILLGRDGEFSAVSADGLVLPVVSSSYNHYALGVVNGEWAKTDEYAPKANPVFTGSISLGRAANSTVGANSVAEGVDTTASGPYSHAEGTGGTFTLNGTSYTSAAAGTADHSEGYQTLTASNNQPGNHAEGYQTRATGGAAHSEGITTLASGNASHAEGSITTASGTQSHAEGNTTTASGAQSHAEGAVTTASGSQSHAEGQNTTASGAQSHAEGAGTTASTDQAHAEGYNATASGYQAHAEGNNTKASGGQSHAEGYGGTFTISGTSYTSAAVGMADHTEGYQTVTVSNQPGNHAEGYQTRATGGAAHSEGVTTLASGNASHAEGAGTTASGTQSHAEGSATTASGSQAHAEGQNTKASSSYSHAEGLNTTASGATSHAEGNNTTASGEESHAEGYNTTASGGYSHVSGKYNVIDSRGNWPAWVANTYYNVGDKVTRSGNAYICKTANSDSSFTSSKWTKVEYMNYAEIVGNGTGTSARSNARVLDWDGNERLMGDIYVGCNADSSGGTKLTAPVGMTGADGTNAGTAGYVPAPAATDNTKYLKGDGTWADVDALPAVTSSDNGKVLKVASGDWSVENEQDISGLAPKASPVFTGSISLGRKANTTVGANSIAIGTTVIASGNQSQAMGSLTTASGTQSHAEGNNTTASAAYSHAEGDGTTASGKNSHAEGDGTTANHKSQHASGEYNVLDSSSNGVVERGNYVEIIGNGTADNTRSNARTLDWNGNERLKGDIYVGCNADSTGGTKLEPLPTVTSSDNGKFLTVVNGAWAATTMQAWQGGSY